MEQQLINAGWQKVDANEWNHPDGRRLYRDLDRTHRWYLKEKDRPARKMGRTFGEAIGKVMEVKTDA